MELSACPLTAHGPTKARDLPRIWTSSLLAVYLWPPRVNRGNRWGRFPFDPLLRRVWWGCSRPPTGSPASVLPPPSRLSNGSRRAASPVRAVIPPHAGPCHPVPRQAREAHSLYLLATLTVLSSSSLHYRAPDRTRSPAVLFPGASSSLMRGVGGHHRLTRP